MNHDIFGYIRALCHQKRPSLYDWAFLCQQLDCLEDEAAAKTIGPYVKHHLQHWSHLKRWMPDQWVRALVQGFQVPFASLSNAIRFESKTHRHNHILPLLHMEDTSNIEHIYSSHDHHLQVDVLEYIFSMQARKIKTLDMTSYYLGLPSVMDQMVQSPALQQLTHLALPRCGFGAHFVENWPGMIFLKTLTHLDLSDNSMLRTSLHDILQTPMPALSALALRGEMLHHTNQRQMNNLPVFNTIQTLDLGVTSNLQTTSFFEQTNLSALEHLSLQSWRGGTFDGVVESVPIYIQKQLKTLNLSQALDKGSGTTTRMHELAFDRLETLDLSNNDLKSTVIQDVARQVWFSTLHHLNLAGNQLHKKTCHALVKSGIAPKTLSLSNCNLSDAAIDILNMGKTLSSVSHLDLTHNPLTKTIVLKCLEDQNTPHLRQLHLAPNHITDQIERRLHQRGVLYNCHLPDRFSLMETFNT